MSWYRLEGGLPQHAKYAPLSDAAFRLAITAGCWCADKMTDGRIPKQMVRALTRAPSGRRLDSKIQELLAARIWEDGGDLYFVHDFLDWNMSREQWMVKVSSAKAGGAAKAAKALASHLPHGKPHGREVASHMACQKPARCSAITLPSPLPDSDSDSEERRDPEEIPPNPPRGKSKAKPVSETTEGNQLKIHYASEFERLRGAKFDLPGKQWGRATNAFVSLAETYGLERSKEICTRALGDTYCHRVAPWDIANNAANHLGSKPNAQLKLVRPPQPNDTSNPVKLRGIDY